jgi:FkbM family methyltransferase
MRFVKRVLRALLGACGIDVIRVPGPQAHVLVMRRATRRALGQDLLLHEHLAFVFDRYRVDCAIDVGANAGDYAAELRRMGYRGRLLAFEPIPELAERIRARAAGDTAWSVHAIALGRHTGTAALNVTRQDVFTSLREPALYAGQRFGASADVMRRVPVSVRRLEDVLDEMLGPSSAARCFVKIDTQGTDLDVFAGLGRWTDRVVALQSELAAIPIYAGVPRMSEALATFEAAGFELSGLFPVSRDETTGRVIELDCVMVRAAAL